jgi:hypothetical protein
MKEPELSYWRVNPILLPQGVDRLRTGYNYHGGYYATVASVVIETPTRGHFTPLLQCEFDLSMTPLLEMRWHQRRVMFCQLSLPEGAGVDPSATRLAENLLKYMVTPLPAARPLRVLGNEADVQLARDLGAQVDAAAGAQTLEAGGVALVGEVPADQLDALKSWVSSGGTAIVLPRKDAAWYRQIPGLAEVKSTTGTYFPAAAQQPLCAGLGVNDFHYRQPQPVLSFGDRPAVADVADGQGRWVLIGFDPRLINIEQQPYLRLSWRHMHRALAQIAANAGAELPLAADAMITRAGGAALTLDISRDGQARIAEHSAELDEQWIQPRFDDSAWTPFHLETQQTPFGHAALRIHFSASRELAEHEDLVADLGTIDDYDETYLNGIRIGSVDPANSAPDQAWKTPRRYRIPPGALRPGANVLAIRAWNRNAESKDWKAQIRGTQTIHPAGGDQAPSPYMGTYRHSDDSYLQYHW